jgi:hypothetical protein
MFELHKMNLMKCVKSCKLRFCKYWVEEGSRRAVVGEGKRFSDQCVWAPRRLFNPLRPSPKSSTLKKNMGLFLKKKTYWASPSPADPLSSAG